MRKLLTFITISSLAISLTACGNTAGKNKVKTDSSAILPSAQSTATDPSLENVKNAGELKIGLEGDWQPFSYHDESD